MRAVRLAFSDFPGPFNPDRLLTLLRGRLNIEVTDQAPDYVIYSVSGHDYLKYNDCIRIFFTGENIRPDFNLCDYAFSYDWLEFGDRHYRAPNFVLYDQWADIVRRGRSVIDRSSLEGKRRFCNFIYTNGRGHPYRDQLFHALHKVKKVDSFGAHLRNVEEEVGSAYTGDWPAQKVAAQRVYKFSIAVENSSTPGYTTEKLVHALAADTIPIYWGDPLVGRIFNERRFINLNGVSLEDAVNRIVQIDEDDELFLEIINQPFFHSAAAPESITQEALVDKFDAIFARPKEEALRRNPYYWGMFYEAQRIQEIQALSRMREAKSPFRWARRIRRSMRTNRWVS